MEHKKFPTLDTYSRHKFAGHLKTHIYIDASEHSLRLESVFSLVDDWAVGVLVLFDDGHDEGDEFGPKVQVLEARALLLRLSLLLLWLFLLLLLLFLSSVFICLFVFLLSFRLREKV